MRLLIRRWYILVAGLVLSLLAVAMVFQVVPPTYSATSAQVLLTTPHDSTTSKVAPQAASGPIPAPGNPLLQLGGGYNVLAELMAKMMNGVQGQLAVQSAGGSGDYVVDIVPGEAPVLSISVEATTPANALGTERVVRKVLAQTLLAQQRAAGAPTDALVIVRPVFEPIEATYEPASRVRAGGALLLVGVALTVGLAFLVESNAERRRRLHGPNQPPRRGASHAAKRAAEPAEVDEAEGAAARWHEAHARTPRG